MRWPGGRSPTVGLFNGGTLKVPSLFGIPLTKELWHYTFTQMLHLAKESWHRAPALNLLQHETNLLSLQIPHPPPKMRKTLWLNAFSLPTNLSFTVDYQSSSTQMYALSILHCHVQAIEWLNPIPSFQSSTCSVFNCSWGSRLHLHALHLKMQSHFHARYQHLHHHQHEIWNQVKEDKQHLFYHPLTLLCTKVLMVIMCDTVYTDSKHVT